MKNIITKFAHALLPVALLFVAATSHAATIYGDTIDCSVTAGGSCSVPSAKAGKGDEFEIMNNGQEYFTVNFTTTDLIITATQNSTFFATPHEFIFSDVGHAFTGADLMSGDSKFDAKDLSLVGGNLVLTFANLSFLCGQTIDICFTTAAVSSVPLPPALSLFLTALAGLLLFRFLQKRKTNNNDGLMSI